jgi:hypothetical protein
VFSSPLVLEKTKSVTRQTVVFRSAVMVSVSGGVIMQEMAA